MADKALLLGINNYESISDLRGCENDVRNMARLLTEKFGFRESNIRQHVNEQVTKPFVADGFDWLLRDAQRGERLVFHFSGHGSYIQSADNDEAIDELLCLYDMDIENPDSYLLDDDLGRWTARTPAGVYLTIVLDTCHSGTGTRRLTAGPNTTRGEAKAPLLIVEATSKRMADGDSQKLKRQLSRGESSAVKKLEERDLVLARVYEYSAQVQARKSRSPIRKFGQSLAMGRSAALNHQLLAAAADTQTAADAYIDNDYHGAFTYHLCEAARRSAAQATLLQIMDAASSAIHSAGFSQNPQNEGPFEQLFGPVAAPEQDEDAPIEVTPESGQPPRTDGTGEPAPAAVTSSVELLAQMLRVAEKFVDLADYVLRQAPDRTGAAPLVTRTGNEFVVYVHGISRHVEGYSLGWWNALEQHLSRTIGRQEVLWSPVVNPRGLRAAPHAPTPEEEDFAEELAMILEDRQQQLLATAPEASRGAVATPADTLPVATMRGDGFSIDDFARYMLNQDEREEILARFDDKVRPLLAAGATVHIISHSWGTVVAWEGLRRMDETQLAGRVANLFVVGSALSLRPVQTNLRDRIPNGNRPLHVDRIFNLDARSDVVGGPIRHRFAVDQEFLGLEAPGCSFFNIACAHSSYFLANNAAVNRDIFARLINR